MISTLSSSKSMDVSLEFGPSFTMATAHLKPGDSIKVEPGAMVSQSMGLEMKTGMSGKGGGLGGFLKSVAKSVFGGESFFLNTFTAGSGGGWISMAPSSPGDSKTLEIEPGSNIFMQGGAFLASSPNVSYDLKFQGAKSLFSRESMFFLRAFSEGGPGQILYSAYGAIKEIDVTPSTPLKVDNGHLVAFTDGVQYDVVPSGGLKTSLFGGEALVLQIQGSGKVWIQTRNIEAFASSIIPFLPERSN
ncbi:MAG: TIGR00266 family protein [Candidatus Thermoplasmatota archaeon]|nr:TIGR00266 family protein [Candidatus Thermoplasmatota archaeon]